MEFGKCLIVLKKRVGHVNWENWLENNFHLKVRSAQNFMEISRRFSKTQTFEFLGYSQLLQIMLFPEGEEKAFLKA